MVRMHWNPVVVVYKGCIVRASWVMTELLPKIHRIARVDTAPIIDVHHAFIAPFT